MDKRIKDIIIGNYKSFEQVMNDLNSIEEDIKLAKKVITKEYTYCKECDDFYLSESFLQKTEIKPEKICTYTDPNQSSENEYRDGYMEYHYRICPKGHKYILFKQEKK